MYLIQKIVFSFLLTIFFFNSTLIASTISLGVASNISYVIKPLIKEFQKNHKDIRVQVSLGSSGKLTAQIKNGAPYDIFMSANMNYPNSLYTSGISLSKPKIYAFGKLALLSVKSRDLTQGLKVLQLSSIKRIAIANPKTAPYGLATAEALKTTKIYKVIKTKIIYGESISQTLSYSLHATDIGIVALSALYSPSMEKYHNAKHFKELNGNSYTPIAQGVILLKRAKDRSDAKVFYKFLFSSQAKEILKSYGYNTL